MAKFITLVNLTEKGIVEFRDSPSRAGAFKSIADKAGVTVKEVYWTMGSHDAVMIIEAGDDESVAAAMLGLGSLGNVRTQTLRAFSAGEMKDIISKVPE